jgi:hypothetical protein
VKQPDRHPDPADLIIVLTDAGGTVTGVNQTVERLTMTSRLAWIGAPRAQLCHADVPGGLRSVYTRMLADGDPTGGYLHLADKNGAGLWMALITIGAGDEQVTVGAPPLHGTPVRDVARVFADVAQAERTALDGGCSRETATALGAEDLRTRLADQGFGDYRDLMCATFPPEVIARKRAGEAPGDPALQPLWDAAILLDTMIENQQRAQDKLLEVFGVLVGAAQDLLAQTEPMETAARRVVGAAQDGNGSSATLLTAAHRASSAIQETSVRLRALARGIDHARDLVMEQRLALAGVRLISHGVVDTIVRAQKLAPQDLPLIAPLLGAVRAQGPSLAMGSARVGAGLARMAKEATETSGQVRALGSTLASWQLLATRFRMPTTLLPADVDSAADADRLDGMRDLARGAMAKTLVLDSAAYADAAAGVSRALRVLPHPYR